MNPIIVDDRTGSKEFLPILIGAKRLARLEFGDFCFEGADGDYDGRSALVGVERKTISDFLGSVDSGRLGAYQIPGMKAVYDVVVLLIEGDFVYNDDGIVCYPGRGGMHRPVIGGKKPHTFAAVEGFLNTARFKHGVIIERSRDMRDSARKIERMRDWWGKPIEGHKAIGIEAGLRKEEINESGGGGLCARAGRRIGIVERVAAQIPGVGGERAIEAGKVFGSVLEMALAGEKDWGKVKGIGKGTAKKAVEALQGSK